MSNDINNPYSERAEEFKEWAEKVLRLFADIRKLSEGLEEDYKGLSTLFWDLCTDSHPAPQGDPEEVVIDI